MPRAAILGTGLIGASMGLALRGQGWETVGWDPSAEALETALDMSSLDRTSSSPDEAVSDADLVFLAGPPTANIETLRDLQTTALVTDASGVKRPLLDVASESVRFVGGHPMAGREHAGPGSASPALFRGAAWIICGDGADPADVERLAAIVASIGANPVEMPAALHDEVVAEISHLPHLIATALVNLVAEAPGTGDLVSGSFRDLTRVAGADSAWWPELLVENADEVSAAVDRLISRLESLKGLIDLGDHAALERQIEGARSVRRGMAPPVSRVRVILQDRPGEIARVGHALEASHVDVRDLQLRHAEHGGGGILTIMVRPGETETLKAALAVEGFETE